CVGHSCGSSSSSESSSPWEMFASLRIRSTSHTQASPRWRPCWSRSTWQSRGSPRSCSRAVRARAWRHPTPRTNRWLFGERASSDGRARRNYPGPMFDHVTIRASSRAASERFYEVVLRAIGNERTHSDEHYAEWDDFSLAQTTAGKPVTRRLHIAFYASSRELVDAFWHAGIDAGYRDDGAPGVRPVCGG